MDSIRLGTIGTGSIVRSILADCSIIDGISLEAVFSRDINKAMNLAGEFGASKVYADINEFMGDSEINTVYIASPNSMHYYYAESALKSGKNVICEKPFTPSLSMAERLMDLAEKNNLLLIEAVPTTFLPNYHVLKEAVSLIGPVKLVQANYSQYSSRYNNLLNGEITNVFNPDYCGGCLMDINYYNVYMTISLFGNPLSAEYFPNLYKLPDCSNSVKSPEKHIDTSGTVLMKYDGFTASCCGAKDTWGVNYYQIEGEKGFIYAEDGGNGIKSVRIVTNEKDETINLQNKDRWYYEFAELTKILLNHDTKVLSPRLEIMKNTVITVENIRRNSGILFLSDMSK